MVSKHHFYPWEMGNRLAVEVQAGDAVAARDVFFELLDIVEKEFHHDDFIGIKLRAIQITTLLVRGAYDAGADANRLMKKNIEFIKWIYEANQLDALKSIVEKIIDNAIALIPENNYYDNKRINQAIAYINKNYDKAISRYQVAKEAGVSVSYISKLFSRITGSSFKEYVLTVKVRKAQNILQNSNCSINEVSYKLGFCDPNYFSTVFKRVAGIPPGKYRRKVRNP